VAFEERKAFAIIPRLHFGHELFCNLLNLILRLESSSENSRNSGEKKVNDQRFHKDARLREIAAQFKDDRDFPQMFFEMGQTQNS